MEEKQYAKPVVSVVRRFSDYSHSAAMICAMHKLRNEGKLCDIVIKTQDREYPAHKIVLVAFSPYFEAMFCGNFTEGDKDCVTISNIDANTMEIMLEYAYSAYIEITTSNVQAILHAANFLQTVPLFERCCRFLENSLAVDNCIGVWNMAEAYSCRFLKLSSEKYILEHFTEVSAECEFLMLESGRLVEIISNDSLNVEKEEVVLNAVIQWFNYKEEERTEVLGDVLEQVRLAHIDAYNLFDKAKALPAIQKSAKCANLIEAAKNFMLLPHRRMDFQYSITRRRYNFSHVEALQVYRKRPGSSKNKDIRITEDLRVVVDGIDYSEVPGAEEVDHLCTQVHNYKALAVSDDYKRIWKLDDDEDWEEIAPLEGNREMVLVELDGFWYAFRGSLPPNGPNEANDINAEKYDDIRRNVHRYDPSEDEWTVVAQLPGPVRKPAVVTAQGMLYVIGGIGKNVINVQRFDPRSNEWTKETPLRSELVWPNACAFNSRIYVCSSATKSEVHVYDCATNKWGRCADMTNSFVSGPVVMNGRMFVISERADGQRVIERYTPVTDTWQEFALFPGFIINKIESPLIFSRDSVSEKPDVKITSLV